jgi:hypothetical protein
MIPETGTNLELKQAWFDARLTPVAGEFYASRQFYGVEKEYMRVKEVIFNRRRMEESTVLIENLTYTDGLPVLVRKAPCDSMTLADWWFMISEGFMEYAGDNLPVASGLVMREQ